MRDSNTIATNVIIKLAFKEISMHTKGHCIMELNIIALIEPRWLARPTACLYRMPTTQTNRELTRVTIVV